MRARCDPRGFSSLSRRNDPLSWQFYSFRSSSSVTTTAQSPSPSPSLSTATATTRALAAFSLAQSPLLPLLFIFCSERRFCSVLFCFAFAIHCQLPCAFCFPLFSSAISLPVYLYLCVCLFVPVPPTFPSCCGFSCLESFTFYCRIILSRLAQTQRFTTKSSSLVTLT